MNRFEWKGNMTQLLLNIHILLFPSAFMHLWIYYFSNS